MNMKTTSLLVSLAISPMIPTGFAHAQVATDVQCAQCVDSSDIANNSIGIGKIKNGAVSTGRLKNAAVTTTKIKDNAVTQSKLSADIRNLLEELDTLIQGPIGALAQIVKIDGDTVQFEGVNVQIINGTGQTNSINGTGNLIVGYDEDVGLSGFGSQLVCSDGAFETENECLINGGTFANAQKTGSHNLVVGMGHSYTQFGGSVLGTRNAINRSHANVTAGELNIASGEQAGVSGGSSNTASGESASISGGGANDATGEDASVSGGFRNLASGRSASVSGGLDNIASSNQTSISGGSLNVASAQVSSVSGGIQNTASGNFSAVTGGARNSATGSSSTVSGGADRSANGLNDWAAGSLLENN